MNENWIATWGTAQQLAPAAEPGGGPQMPDDDVHPNDAGHRAIAEVFDLDLFR